MNVERLSITNPTFFESVEKSIGKTKQTIAEVNGKPSPLNDSSDAQGAAKILESTLLLVYVAAAPVYVFGNILLKTFESDAKKDEISINREIIRKEKNIQNLETEIRTNHMMARDLIPGSSHNTAIAYYQQKNEGLSLGIQKLQVEIDGLKEKKADNAFIQLVNSKNEIAINKEIGKREKNIKNIYSEIVQNKDTIDGLKAPDQQNAKKYYERLNGKLTVEIEALQVEISRLK